MSTFHNKRESGHVHIHLGPDPFCGRPLLRHHDNKTASSVDPGDHWLCETQVELDEEPTCSLHELSLGTKSILSGHLLPHMSSRTTVNAAVKQQLKACRKLWRQHAKHLTYLFLLLLHRIRTRCSLILHHHHHRHLLGQPR